MTICLWWLNATTGSRNIKGKAMVFEVVAVYLAPQLFSINFLSDIQLSFVICKQPYNIHKHTLSAVFSLN